MTSAVALFQKIAGRGVSRRHACIDSGRFEPMSAVKGRRPRPRSSGAPDPIPTVPLQARIPVEVHRQAQATADALKVSLTRYIQSLLEHDQSTALDEDGRPTWWTETPAEEEAQEVLPLKTSA
jgi:hypothetical protein